MYNHHEAPRLAAQGPHPAPPSMRRPSSRVKGEEFDALLRTKILAIALSLPTLPEPAQLFSDLQRRQVRAGTHGAAIVALSRDPRVTDAQLDELHVDFAAWILSLRPRMAHSLRTLLETEALEQSQCDVATFRVFDAHERRDVCAYDAAIAEASQHMVALRQVLSGLFIGRRQLAGADHPLREAFV